MGGLSEIAGGGPFGVPPRRGAVALPSAHHPDKGGEAEGVRLKEYNAAKAVLLDAALRQEYDRCAGPSPCPGGCWRHPPPLKPVGGGAAHCDSTAASRILCGSVAPEMTWAEREARRPRRCREGVRPPRRREVGPPPIVEEVGVSGHPAGPAMQVPGRGPDVYRLLGPGSVGALPRPGAALGAGGGGGRRTSVGCPPTNARKGLPARTLGMEDRCK